MLREENDISDEKKVEGEAESELEDDVEFEYEGWDYELSDVHSIDHLSEGEDELMEVRNGKQIAKEESQSLPKEQPKLGVKKKTESQMR